MVLAAGAASAAASGIAILTIQVTSAVRLVAEAAVNAVADGVAAALDGSPAVVSSGPVRRGSLDKLFDTFPKPAPLEVGVD